MRKTLEKTNSIDTLQNVEPILLEILKVMKNKERLRNCHTKVRWELYTM